MICEKYTYRPINEQVFESVEAAHDILDNLESPSQYRIYSIDDIEKFSEKKTIILRETLTLKLIAQQLENMLFNLRQSGDLPKSTIIRGLENVLETTNEGLKNNV